MTVSSVSVKAASSSNNGEMTEEEELASVKERLRKVIAADVPMWTHVCVSSCWAGLGLLMFLPLTCSCSHSVGHTLPLSHAIQCMLCSLLQAELGKARLIADLNTLQEAIIATAAPPVTENACAGGEEQSGEVGAVSEGNENTNAVLGNAQNPSSDSGAATTSDKLTASGSSKATGWSAASTRSVLKKLQDLAGLRDAETRANAEK